MAESEETTENVEEVTSTEATAEATPSEEKATATGTRKERNAAARAAKAKPASGPRTLEDRLERVRHGEDLRAGFWHVLTRAQHTSAAEVSGYHQVPVH